MFRKTLLWLALVGLVSAPAFALDPPILGVPGNREPAVKIDKLTLAWVPVTGAESYKVQLSLKPNLSEVLPLENADAVKKTAARDDVFYPVKLTPPTTIQPATTYFWRVIALCTPDTPCVPGTSEIQSFTTEMTFKPATKLGFSLSRAVEGDKAAKPAVFKWAHTLEKGDVYTADYALQWKSKPVSLPRQFLHYSVFTEGILSSDDKATGTAIRFGAGLLHDWTPVEGMSFFNRLSLAHEANQSYDTRKNVGQLSVTTSWDKLAMGTRIPLDRNGNIEVSWLPTLSITRGRTLEIGDSAEVEKEIERYSLRIATTTELVGIARKLNFRRVSLTIAGTAWLLPRETVDQHDLLEGALQFDIIDNVSFGFDYKRGEEAPEFKTVESYGLALGVRF